MKTKFTAFFLSAALIFSCFSLAGCTNKKNAALVYFLNFKPESAAAYEEIANKYEAETGVKVKIVTAAANTYEQTLKSEIAKSNPPTIFQVNGPVGYDTWDDYCLNIKDSKLYGYLSDKSLAIHDDGGVYAIPCVVEGYGIIYNNAIMKRYFALPSKKTNFHDMSEIKSFDDLKKVVEDMTANKQKLSIEGVFASTSLSAGEDWRWQTHLLNVPIFYEISQKHKEGDPTLALLDADEITLKYTENYKKIFDLYLNNSITPKNLLGGKSVADSMAEFALGKVAMVQNGNWGWSQISGVKGNTVTAEDIKMLPIYTGIDGEENQGLCIGTENYLAINKNASAEQQKASLAFLEWLFGSETGKKYVTEKLGFITPFNTFSEKETPADPLAREITRYMKDENLKTIPWVFNAFPGEAFKKATGDALLDYAQGKKEWDKVKSEIVKSWKSERD